MNRKELEIKMKKLGFDKNYYSLYGKVVMEKSILVYRDKKWIIYGFNDRGGRCDDDKIFNTESEACDYLYNNLLQTKWANDNIYVGNNFPAWEDRIGYEETKEGKVNAILIDGTRWPGDDEKIN